MPDRPRSGGPGVGKSDPDGRGGRRCGSVLVPPDLARQNTPGLVRPTGPPDPSVVGTAGGSGPGGHRYRGEQPGAARGSTTSSRRRDPPRLFIAGTPHARRTASIRPVATVAIHRKRPFTEGRTASGAVRSQ